MRRQVNIVALLLIILICLSAFVAVFAEDEGIVEGTDRGKQETVLKSTLEAIEDSKESVIPELIKTASILAFGIITIVVIYKRANDDTLIKKDSSKDKLLKENKDKSKEEDRELSINEIIGIYTALDIAEHIEERKAELRARRNGG